ncbi:Uncharacterised protein [Sphingobacterium thalpophilum]|uniref:Uncharacterized protein n=1 Tax=Sphingobacterium thalpophilum TaxID=259 RepID=A0A4U9UMU9_9SPHI|nr:Uncharacterised protein [Sphingobacterium thalpophilum]
MPWQALMLQVVGPEPVSTKRSKEEGNKAAFGS